MTLADMARCLNQDYKPDNNTDKKHPAAFFITDQNAVPEPEKIVARLPDYCAVIFRDYDHPLREKAGRKLSEACRKKGLPFLVARDISLAEELLADGIHLPQGLMQQAPQVRAKYPHWIITAACHDMASVMDANNLPLDAVLIAPVFPTLSHPGTRSLGLPMVKEMTASVTVPLYALGGVTKKNAGQLIGSGIAGIAAIRGFKD
ncbi:MAG: thiamine phosphate synthase [Alphaproteobacteria bacterium]|nr:thiamine phosphate synthase [Alphaproteobacteria bacterium]